VRIDEDLFCHEVRADLCGASLLDRTAGTDYELMASAARVDDEVPPLGVADTGQRATVPELRFFLSAKDARARKAESSTNFFFHELSAAGLPLRARGCGDLAVGVAHGCSRNDLNLRRRHSVVGGTADQDRERGRCLSLVLARQQPVGADSP